MRSFSTALGLMTEDELILAPIGTSIDDVVFVESPWDNPVTQLGGESVVLDRNELVWMIFHERLLALIDGFAVDSYKAISGMYPEYEQAEFVDKQRVSAALLSGIETKIDLALIEAWKDGGDELEFAKAVMAKAGEFAQMKSDLSALISRSRQAVSGATESDWQATVDMVIAIASDKAQGLQPLLAERMKIEIEKLDKSISELWAGLQ